MDDGCRVIGCLASSFVGGYDLVDNSHVPNNLVERPSLQNLDIKGSEAYVAVRSDHYGIRCQVLDSV